MEDDDDDKPAPSKTQRSRAPNKKKAEEKAPATPEINQNGEYGKRYKRRKTDSSKTILIPENQPAAIKEEPMTQPKEDNEDQ